MASDYPRPFVALSYTLLAALLALAVALAMRGSAISAGPVAVFVVLVVFASVNEVELPSGDNISAALMLDIAAVVVFAVKEEPLSALLVGLSFGVYWPHLRNRDWPKVAFNAANFGIATMAAFMVVSSAPSAWLDSPPMLLLIGGIAVAVFMAVEDVVLGLGMALAQIRTIRESVREFLPSDFQAIPFAVLGAFVGSLYLNVGPIIVPLLIAPILVARQVFATSVELKETEDSAVQTLIKALEAKDRYTAGHVERVAIYSVYIGEELGLGPGRIERLRLAALMHDIGKLIVPNRLLNKPGRLTAEEYEEVKRHEDVSIELLSSIDFLAPVAPSASSEFTDYKPTDPRHPIEPYIVHVADAYDAMASTRSYRKALSQDVAFEELRQKAGTQFHPVVVEALIAAIDERGEVHGAEHETDAGDWVVPPPVVGTGSAGLGDLEPPQQASP